MKPNTEAIYRELPWLAKHYKRSKVTDARVSRVTADLMDKRAFGEAGRHYNFIGWTSNGKIGLHDQEGRLLGRVGKPVNLATILYWAAVAITLTIFVMFLPAPYSAESVGQALLRFGKDAHYVVWLKTNGELVVYKAPKGYTVEGWYNEQIRLSEQSLRQTFEEIDREPTS